LSRVFSFANQRGKGTRGRWTPCTLQRRSGFAQLVKSFTLVSALTIYELFSPFTVPWPACGQSIEHALSWVTLLVISPGSSRRVHELGSETAGSKSTSRIGSIIIMSKRLNRHRYKPPWVSDDRADYTNRTLAGESFPRRHKIEVLRDFLGADLLGTPRKKVSSGPGREALVVAKQLHSASERDHK
jgi:hypothetical protein